jgi:DNA-binding LacI/PurR family transcriptional regulator
MKINLKEIADRSGVSVMTVSNVINGREGRYSQSTYDLVMQVAAELGYVPNLAAKYLRKGKMGLIALVLPDILNPYMAELSQSVIIEAAAQGYTTVLSFTNNDTETVRRILDGSLPLPVDGIMVAPHLLNVAEFKVNVPVLLFGEHQADTSFDNIVLNHVAIAQAATRHLIDLGRTWIAPIGLVDGDNLGDMPQQREQGYEQAMRTAGLPVDPAWMIRTETPSFHREHGAFVMEKLLALGNVPDALFCFNDLLALGAIKALIQAGYRVPEDVAVIGVDDIVESKYYNPSLSTIAVDRGKIAALGVRLLVDRIEGTRSSPPEFFEVQFSLIARESTIGRDYRGDSEKLDG